MLNLTSECGSCPRVAEAGRLQQASALPYCFDCPAGYRAARFTAFAARVGARKTPVRSCRKVTGSGAR